MFQYEVSKAHARGPVELEARHKDPTLLYFVLPYLTLPYLWGRGPSGRALSRVVYRVTCLIRKCNPLGPYSRPMPRFLRRS